MEAPFKSVTPADETPVVSPAPAPEAQITTPDDAALLIYNSLLKEGFSIKDKIEIVRLIGVNIKSEIDQEVRALSLLKQSF